MPDIVANGIRIHYERTGGNKPPVLLLHGITDSGRCWPRVVEALKKDYDVIAPDARAHGFSEAPASGYTYENMAADVAGLAQALGLIKPAVIGHSNGGMTAAVLGANHPDVARCLVLEDPPFRQAERTPEQLAGEARKWTNRIEAMHETTSEEQIKENKKGAKGDRAWADVEYGPWVEAKQQVNLNIVPIERNAPPPWRQTVPRIVCPTLLVTADPAKGSIVTPDVAQEVLALNPHFQLLNCPRAGHNIRRESYAEFMSAVIAFLASVPR